MLDFTFLEKVTTFLDITRSLGLNGTQNKWQVVQVFISNTVKIREMQNYHNKENTKTEINKIMLWFCVLTTYI